MALNLIALIRPRVLFEFGEESGDVVLNLSVAFFLPLSPPFRQSVVLDNHRTGQLSCLLRWRRGRRGGKLTSTGLAAPMFIVPSHLNTMLRADYSIRISA